MRTLENPMQIKTWSLTGANAHQLRLRNYMQH